MQTRLQPEMRPAVDMRASMTDPLAAIIANLLFIVCVDTVPPPRRCVKVNAAFYFPRRFRHRF